MKKKIFLSFIVLAFSLLFTYSVKAYTLGTDSKGNEINEDFIYDLFVEIGENDSKPFDIRQFNYIYCNVGTKTFTCNAIDNRFIGKIFRPSSVNASLGYYALGLPAYTNLYTFRYSFTDSSIESYNVYYDPTRPFEGGVTGIFPLYRDKENGLTSYTNFDSIVINDTATYKNYLRFEKYLDINYNLFANDENFKKVCVNDNSLFSITKNHSDGLTSGSEHDFIWFPYGISGIKQFNYSTESSDGYYEFEDPFENFYFSNYENINTIWNTPYMKDNFESKGYTDKYQYYGYTAYLFLHWYNFDDGQIYNFFPIFEVTSNVTTSHLSTDGNIHGGGGLRLDGDDEVEISNEYCFYIKKEYEVNEVKLDEWGDHYVSVNTPNGPINYGTTINKDNANSNSFLSQPIKFISEMSGTINFLNANIYNLYMSMPLVVRTFLITALIIFIVMLFMKLGGYQ